MTRLAKTAVALSLGLALAACGQNAVPAGDGGAHGDGGATADAASSDGSVQPDAKAPPSGVTFETIEKETMAAWGQPFNVVIDNKTDWEAFYRKLKHSGSGATTPAVDFGTHVVVGVGLGNRPSGGYTTSVVAIGQPAGEQHLLVSYVESTVGYGCGAGGVVTQPYHLVKVTKQSLPFRFEITVAPGKPCSPPPTDDCTKLTDKTRAALAALNRCVADSDCASHAGQCPFGCYLLTHTSVASSAVTAALADYRASNCRKCAYGCAAPGDIKCIGGRCEMAWPEP